MLTLVAVTPVQAAGPHNPDFDQPPELNLDTFMVPLPNEAVSLRVGHHQAASQGLLFEGSANWGVSADAKLDAINSDLSLFGVHAAGGGNAGRGVSLSDGSDYFTGGNFQARVPVPWMGLNLSASYVMGRESEVDTFGGHQFGRAVGQGVGYSLGLESTWFRDQVRLDLERALTRFARDSVKDHESLDDKAYSAALIYAPDLGSLPLDWEIGAESLNVGPQFRSPANQGLSRNRSLDRIFTRIRPGSNWSLGYSYQEHGAGGENDRHRTQGDEVFADLTLRFSDRFRIKPYAQFEREYNRQFQSTAYHSLLSLTLDAWLIPGSLFYRNTVRVDERRSPLDSGFGGDRRRRYVASEFKWHALKPSRQRLGFDINLSLSADEVETERESHSGLNNYKLRLSISSSRF
ncbi:hypothetical protein DES49_2736 [Halospina denitrificans]|uniref:Beta-barrel porin 2 n=2 Tax=Halospina denitrificans TaxID=332522 RepID=A0A4R7JK22_9GAMM|nr:hypothetical protein DES49_2736 [Halospina denitrificans]